LTFSVDYSLLIGGYFSGHNLIAKHQMWLREVHYATSLEEVF